MSKLDLDFLKSMYHSEKKQVMRLEEFKQQIVINLKKENCPNRAKLESILETISASISEIKEYVEKYRWMIQAKEPDYQFELQMK